ncbi:MAG: carbonic anhydrase [Thermoguttaceae bacterium]
MNARNNDTVYESSVRFDENRIRAAALYCSDGRFGEQIDDFLHNGLKLPRCDRLVVPGGAASLAGHFLAFREEEGLLEQLRFLIRAHDLQRLVLIAHQDCAFYTERLHVTSPQLETRQQDDLQAAAERLRSFSRILVVEGFFARKHADGTVRFESLKQTGQ